LWQRGNGRRRGISSGLVSIRAFPKESCGLQLYHLYEDGFIRVLFEREEREKVERKRERELGEGQIIAR
jgi:hypothetical protein